MDSLALARSFRGSIGMLAMSWLLEPETVSRAAELGLDAPGMGGYAVGRLGVLGDCPPDNVVAGAYFWEPATMRRMVADGRAVMSPADGAEIYRQICIRWGEANLAGMDGIERLGQLLERVIDEAAPHGAPTFVGWRDQRRPDDHGPGRTFLACQTMRELRFGRHCVAVQAAGLDPLRSIMSGPAGEWNADLFGWSPPYPDVTPDLAEQRAAVEAHTDALHAPDFDLLSDDERAELRGLAKAARAHASPPSPI